VWSVKHKGAPPDEKLHKPQSTAATWFHKSRTNSADSVILVKQHRIIVIL